MGCASSTVGPVAKAHVSRESVSKSYSWYAENFHAKYLLGMKIGKGSYAQVRTAHNTCTHELLAVKIIDVGGPQNRKEANENKVIKAQQEALVWKEVSNHEHCVRLNEVFLEGYLCYMVMERCSGGIMQYLAGTVAINERSLGKLFVQMISGINHVHKLGFVHLDVKPDNFLVGGSNGRTVKLADYGCSATLPASGKLHLPGLKGTAPYMCPDMLLTQTVSAQTDVWSLGVVMYLLLCGGFPYMPRKMTAKNMRETIMDGRDPNCERRWLSNSAVACLASLLNRNPIKRPSAFEALELPYLVDVANESHMVYGDLPSLRAVFDSACKLSPPQQGDLCGENCIDRDLNVKQIEAHNTGIPQTPCNGNTQCNALAPVIIDECTTALKLNVPTESTSSGGSSTVCIDSI